jgi:hypothetical protein
VHKVFGYHFFITLHEDMQHLQHGGNVESPFCHKIIPYLTLYLSLFASVINLYWTIPSQNTCLTAMSCLQEVIGNLKHVCLTFFN